ncbi:hypothetical protein MHBO_002077, partial [Bonamia ostreae]
ITPKMKKTQNKKLIECGDKVVIKPQILIHCFRSFQLCPINMNWFGWPSEFNSIVNRECVVRKLCKKTSLALVEMTAENRSKFILIWVPIKAIKRLAISEKFCRVKSNEKLRSLLRNNLVKNIVSLCTRIVTKVIENKSKDLEDEFGKRFVLEQMARSHLRYFESFENIPFSFPEKTKNFERFLTIEDSFEMSNKLIIEGKDKIAKNNKKLFFKCNEMSLKGEQFHFRNTVLLWKQHILIEHSEALCFSILGKITVPPEVSIVVAGDENCEEVLLELKDNKIFYPFKIDRGEAWVFVLARKAERESRLRNVQIYLLASSTCLELTLGLWLLSVSMDRLKELSLRGKSDRNDEGKVAERIVKTLLPRVKDGIKGVLAIVSQTNCSLYVKLVILRTLSYVLESLKPFCAPEKHFGFSEEISNVVFKDLSFVSEIQKIEKSENSNKEIYSEYYHALLEILILTCFNQIDSTLAEESIVSSDNPRNELAELMSCFSNNSYPNSFLWPELSERIVFVLYMLRYVTGDNRRLDAFEKMAGALSKTAKKKVSWQRVTKEDLEEIAEFEYDSKITKISIEIARELLLEIDNSGNLIFLHVDLRNGKFAKIVRKSKRLLSTKMLLNLTDSILDISSMTWNPKRVKIDRINSEKSIYIQLFDQIGLVDSSKLRIKPSPTGNSVGFFVNFVNESAVGSTGPYREVLEQIFNEIFSVKNDNFLFEPTPNFK